jgi:hypothetical protein
MEQKFIERAKQYLSTDNDKDIERMINLIVNHENKGDLIEMVDDDIDVWQPLEFKLTCQDFLDSIGYIDKDTIMLKAIMERYGDLSTLKQGMYEDTDTVLMNLSVDIDDQFSEDEILLYIRKILG